MKLFNRNNSSLSNKPLFSGKFIKIIGLMGIIIAVIVIINSKKRERDNISSNPSTSNSQVAGAVATTGINKQFDLPIKGSNGKEMGSLKFTIESAEKRKEILVKGQKATAVEGREFLIINMKIDNQLDRSIDVNTRNYIRLSVNGNENEWLAPDIHNDPVEVQAISTKLTRVGFPINSTDSLLMLQIGEIKGNKEKIFLEF